VKVLAQKKNTLDKVRLGPGGLLSVIWKGWWWEWTEREGPYHVTKPKSDQKWGTGIMASSFGGGRKGVRLATPGPKRKH